MTQNQYKIALVGFGEAAMAFAKGWQEIEGLSLYAFDIKTQSKDENIVAAKRRDYDALGVTGTETLAEALSGASAVFSLVTADQAFSAAAAVSASIDKDCLFFDCNSCAPGSKQRSAKRIELAEGRYVDVAVMSPVYPKLHKSPLLICGTHSSAAMTVFAHLQMEAMEMEGDIGSASSVKMIRSIMMKGLEALFAECVLAGRQAGVDEKVLTSLDVTYPGFDFKKRAAYGLERMTAHGKRRSAEMKEVARTIEELGLPNEMTQATVRWQQRIGNYELPAGEEDYQRRADALLTRLHENFTEREIER